MANIQNGQVEWKNVGGGGAGGIGKDAWMRLNPGSNVIRLLTLPHQYHQHRYMVEGGKKYGYRIDCAGQGCPLCQEGDKAKRRWLLGVIDRKTNTYKVLDIGFSVFKSIQTYAKDDEWGDPSGYDIDIVVDPNGGSTGYYTVVTKRPRDLSDGDRLLQQENPVDKLAARVVPPSIEKVAGRIADIKSEVNGNADGGISAALNSSDEEEDEDYFKSADNRK